MQPSTAKLNKMLGFTPDITAKGNGSKVRAAYEAILNAQTAQDVLVAQHNFGGTIGYGTFCYLMQFVAMGQEPPASYFGNASTQPEPTTEEKFPGLDMEFLKSLGYTA